jgi:hypothetical protein
VLVLDYNASAFKSSETFQDKLIEDLLEKGSKTKAASKKNRKIIEEELEKSN